MQIAEFIAAASYLAYAGCYANLALQIIRHHGASDRLAWVILGFTVILWPAIVPFAYLELLHRAASAHGKNGNLD